MRGWTKKLWFVIIFIFIFSGFSGLAHSELPYDGYIYNSWGESVPAPNGYYSSASYTGNQLGIGNLKEPSDIFVDHENNIFISDTGNQRIIQLDACFQPIKIYETIKVGGEEQKLASPGGIFVDEQQNIYFTDKENSRVVKMNISGELLQEYRAPETNLLTDDFVFSPYKVLVNKMGVVFVLTENFSYGAISYNQSGEFLSFWGSNRVELTVEILMNQLWKKILSQEQKSKLERYVPIQYTGFDIDENNFIYTCTQNANVTREQIKKLNALGTNVLPEGEELIFGDLEKGYYMASDIVSQFCDISVAGNGLINALDYTSGRIFQYDQEGRLLTIFGGIGDQEGLCRLPTAVDNLDSTVLVLDQSKNALVVFETTEYMNVVHEAVSLYIEGHYQEAKEIWEKVLQYNHNFEFAYTGIGKANFEQGDYRAAMYYFKLGNERDGYSSAYREYRAEIVRQFSFVMPFFVLLFIPAFLLIWKRKRKTKPAEAVGRSHNTVKNIMRTLIYPTSQYEDFKYYKSWSRPAFLIILLTWFVGTILQRQATGFIFNDYNPNELNILVVFSFTILVFLLCIVVNWAVTSLLEGKGTLKEIGIAGSYALIPHIISLYVYVLVSQFSVLEEKAFLIIIQYIGIFWSLILVLAGLKSIHEYTVKKTIACVILTLIGVAFVVFLMVLMYGLVQQFLSFFNTIYHELVFRG